MHCTKVFYNAKKPFFVADPNNLFSASFCCSINLFNLFCADVESEVDEDARSSLFALHVVNLQLLLSQFL